jgi:hypothetical protein
MDANHQEILDNLEGKKPRSCLEPYRELILRLRRQNRTYREIMRILADGCKIRVSISTLHDFLRAQRRIDSKPRKRKTNGKKVTAAPNEQLPESAKHEEELPAMNDIQQRIAALKQRQTPPQPNVPRFTYDPDLPLQLIPQDKKAGDQD